MNFTKIIQNLMFSTLPPVLAQIRAGRVRAFAVTGAKRSSVVPEVPTIAESGVSGYEATGWWGVLVPGKTPRPLVMKLNAEIVKAMHLPEVQQAFTQQGADPAPGTPEQFAAHMAKESVKWADIIQRSGAKAD